MQKDFTNIIKKSILWLIDYIYEHNKKDIKQYIHISDM